MVEGILFEQVEDRRQDWKVMYLISEILTVVMCGVSTGERSIYGIRKFVRIKFGILGTLRSVVLLFCKSLRNGQILYPPLFF